MTQHALLLLGLKVVRERLQKQQGAQGAGRHAGRPAVLPQPQLALLWQEMTMCRTQQQRPQHQMQQPAEQAQGAGLLGVQQAVLQPAVVALLVARVVVQQMCRQLAKGQAQHPPLLF